MTSEIVQHILETPIGTIQLLAQFEKLISVSLPGENGELTDNKDFQIVTRDHSVFKEIVDYIDRYFSGEHVSWEGKYIPDGSDFFRRAWQEAVKIPFGETISYGELARRSGSPRAARAAGSAMARNHLPILIPCHRVIAGDGGIGGFGNSPGVKRELLRHEGVDI
ncbi:MAG: methylated-DNA--[protein]-cysteine S-methyltransferase [Candidatus Hatepunaea meridiana]|nr:methylated-DNA--[protein]-cysteine S-methyltransferase [Candidatus Hatepunaea meridiana]